MLSISELLVLQELAIFADTHGINKSEVSRNIDVSRQTVHIIINKFKELEINVKK